MSNIITGSGNKAACTPSLSPGVKQKAYTKLPGTKEYESSPLTAVRTESKTNLLFSFEKMALRDAVKIAEGAKAFAEGLYNYIYEI